MFLKHIQEPELTNQETSNEPGNWNQEPELTNQEVGSELTSH
jgi:hypothetical protein